MNPALATVVGAALFGLAGWALRPRATPGAGCAHAPRATRTRGTLDTHDTRGAPRAAGLHAARGTEHAAERELHDHGGEAACAACTHHDLCSE